jgi:8-oxo-dGTP pyrophosphatase MutT (NUDIX family)
MQSNLERELQEELQIVPKEFANIGVVREVFRNEQGEKVGDGVFFVIVVTKWEGEPAEKSEEGEYFWCDIDKIMSLEKIFRTGFERGLPKLKEYLQNPKKFSSYIFENDFDNLGF